ncbi:hypothetical protein E1B28_001122 [Marasmius oreades]|uniref:Uncharacterized protein n=1 Tax=Marasmius oreades TaxID=181124 RepID=A0A9P7V2V7_9AGAR|nr:uncharacterized protein E1B28_001122 [Marasmius oreades]KAG7099259.1 hypothetical protein E1B28_001122 [Marasmius oreades]
MLEAGTRITVRRTVPAHRGHEYRLITLAGSLLDSELSGWLQNVLPTDETFPIPGCKAIIAPHAGYSYSGPVAAWAYKAIDTSGIRRVFILGPSHHVYLDGCALSSCTDYATPIGDLPLDVETILELKETGKFATFDLEDDEAEHSLEMHLPYIRKVFEGKDIKIVPIIVGAISVEKESNFGTLLAPYLARSDTLFVISSDFCHWGTRFSYTFYYPKPSPSDGIRLSRTVGPSSDYPIYESIRQLDHEATTILTIPPSTASETHAQFAKYLVKTKNTICGRHPIGVLLGTLTALEKQKESTVRPTIKWVRYEQSSACETVKDSSVSYASAWIKL